MTRNFKILGILAATAACGLAQVSVGSCYVKGSLISPQGDMRVLTRANIGWGAEFGVVLTLPEAKDVDFGFHADFLSVARKDKVYETFTTKGSMVGLDMRYHLPANLLIYAGPVLTAWDVTGRVRGAAGDTAYKVGYRAGVQWDFRPEMGVGVTYHLSEWQAKAAQPRENGLNPGHPSYVALSFVYHF